MTELLCFVCRPGLIGQQLADTITSLGIPARHTPSLGIEPTAAVRPEKAYDHYIFISPPAVQISFKYHSHWLPANAGIYAVGSGTAAELHKLGYKQVLIPEIFNSEGLLDMPELQAVAGDDVLLIKGEGGRTLLRESLLERGARCHEWSVYTRTRAEIESTHWQAYRAAKGHAITCASIETLDAFEAQRKARNLPMPQQIFVASQRIADHAQSVGYTEIIQVGGAGNDNFIAAITQYYKNG